jgi:hypothetical protein
MSAEQVGQCIKVMLPGESPWAIVTAVLDDGRIMARIDNYPVGDEHGYKYGDVATFERDPDAQRIVWTLAPIDRQHPVGPRP